MSISKLLPIAALGVAFAFAPAEAAPAAPTPAAAGTSEASAVTQVQYGYRRRGYGRGWGAAPWIGLGAGVVVGAIIANEAYRPRRGYYYDDYAYDGPYYYPAGYAGDPRAICAQNFRSFEWRTGLYTTYTGERRLCPYLR
jgi:BA14K-like protein